MKVVEYRRLLAPDDGGASVVHPIRAGIMEQIQTICCAISDFLTLHRCERRVLQYTNNRKLSLVVTLFIGCSVTLAEE